MKDTYVTAKLVQPDLIRLVVFSSLPWEKIEPCLVCDGVASPGMMPTRMNTLSSLAIADFRLDSPLELGKSYFLEMAQYGSIPLDVSEATNFPDFDEKFYYDGNDLGCTYARDHTDFAIWAPLASNVSLCYRKKSTDPWIIECCNRTDKGVYRIRIKGDIEGYEYVYSVTNNETRRRVTDPYAKASSPNGKTSVVANMKKLTEHFHRECLPVLNSNLDAVIYETHVRDFTISPDTNIVNKGRFLGMVEPKRKTKGGHPAGIDYLASLGITHVQLLPIYDFKTVDETDPMAAYNWGYDPAQYFIPEGSFASDLYDPLSRIKDCKKMVSEFHKRGIRVVMDVVYNHVYEYQSSVFERVVPNYYFRHRNNGKMANTSGCGNDLASERPMVRKLIVDACKYWIDEFGIDGLRFDLMGIIDVDTLNAIASYTKTKDYSIILYGEGWNMGGEVKAPLGNMNNARLIPDFGFFSDRFRESTKNVFCGDEYSLGSFKNSIMGSCLSFYGDPIFLNASQALNYIECHDNGTYFDIVASRRGDLSLKERLNTVLAASYAVLFSFGMPFLHMGQEIGQSKEGQDNTYKAGDRLNMMNWALVDERFDMVEKIKEAIALRRSLLAFHIFDPRIIGEYVTVTDSDGATVLSFVDSNLIAPRKGLACIYNTSGHDSSCPIDKNAKIIFGQGKFYDLDGETPRVVVPPHSVTILEVRN